MLFTDNNLYHKLIKGAIETSDIIDITNMVNGIEDSVISTLRNKF